MFLIDEKIAPLEIDRSMLHFGMEMGPIAMIDQIGLDTCAILAQKSPHYAQIKLPRSLVTRISDGFLGVKSGEGFYRYPFGNQKFKIKSKASVCTANIIERLVPFLINSAVDSLAEQWVDNSDLLDAAMVYGGCFPRFRGGPLTYTKNYGREAFYQLIKRFSLEKNNRLKLSSGWENFYE